MITMIIHMVLLTTFVCVGIYMNSDKGDIFYFLRLLTFGWPSFLTKPIVCCVNCMASLWGTIVQGLYYWLIEYMPPAKDAIIVWLLVTVICSGTNGIVWVVYRYFDIVCKVNKDVQ